MINPKQRLANAANAKLSRGPMSDEGKAASRMNALRHGLTAKTILLPGEHGQLLTDLRIAMFEELKPGSLFEGELVEGIVGILWRLRRIPNVERGMILWAHYMKGRSDVVDRGHVLLPPVFGMAIPAAEAENEIWATKKLGRAVNSLLSESDSLGKLSRYETSLMNKLSNMLRLLREEQSRRERLAAVEMIDVAFDVGSPENN